MINVVTHKESRELIEHLQSYNRGMDLNTTIGIAKVLAYRGSIEECKTFTIDGIRSYFKKERAIGYTNVLDRLINHVPVDFRSILELAENMFVTRVISAYPFRSEEYPFGKDVILNNELTGTTRFIPKKVIDAYAENWALIYFVVMHFECFYQLVTTQGEELNG